MSPLAWRILALFIAHVERVYKGEFGHGYIASWTLGKMLGGDASTINGADVKIHPQNEYQQALRELVDLGIVREKPDLPERFELVVKEVSHK